MKIAILGLPGSGKSTLGRQLSSHFNIPHIEADSIFWSDRDLRLETQKLIQQDSWIYEGHLGKMGDIVLPEASVKIFIDHPEIHCLVRTLKRDKNWKRLVFNVIHFYEIRDRMQDLVSRQKNIIRFSSDETFERLLKNFSNLN